MSNLLRVQWTITPQIAPQPWLACRRCDRPRPFRSSGKIRANANGKRLDAWLIYRCMDCGSPWKRPLLERRSIRDIDPASLRALQGNDPRWVDRLAFDVDDLKRWSDRVEEFAAVHVGKRLPSDGPTAPAYVEILLRVTAPTCLRTDRLLADELDLPRSQVQALQVGGRLVIEPHGPRMLRRPVRDGTRLRIDAAAVPTVAGIITERTRHVHSPWLDLGALAGEGDR